MNIKKEATTQGVEDPRSWLKGYERVAKHNQWDETLCLANVYFYLTGTALKWYENNEESIQTWTEFMSQLENVFGKNESSSLRAEKILKTRAQLKEESTEYYIQDVRRLCKEVDPQMNEEDKISHLMKGIAEELYQALLPRDMHNTEQFVTECRRIESLHCKRVTQTKYERLPNVASLSDHDDRADLSSMIRQIVREEVQRALGSTREEPKISTIEDMVKEEIGRTLAPISKPRRSSPQKERPREFYNNRYVAQTIRPHPEPRYPKQGGRRDTNEWQPQEGYWQIDVEESDREKTAFITPDGLYEFKGLKWTICLCYLDDIIVFSDGFEEHLRRLQLVLNCLKKAGLCLNSKKCKFGAKTITVLGHEVSENGIRPDQEKIRAVRDFATPRSLKEVRSFLGLLSYYCRFIPNYAHVAQPLNDLLKKDSAFNWNQEEQNAFEALKSSLISEPTLGHFDYSSPTEIHTDASNYGIGAVLVQIQKGKERAIAYASRTLNKAEKNYSTTERECLAIIWAINKFRPYVFGQPFTIVTDHHSLCWLTNLKDPWHLQPIPVPEVAFEKVGMDLLGRFPTSEGGNRWIIVCTDYLTKYAITKALPTSESMEVAKFFIEDVILKHGAPRELITDRGRNFTSSMISDLNNQCRITHRKTTAYHPQTNGLTERLNKTIADMLSMYVDVNQKDWDRILPFVTFAYNTAKQESTGFTPFFLVHGREAETPLDVLFPKLLPEDDDFIQTLGARAEEARKLARIYSMRSQDSNKHRYDAHHRNIIYQPGDLVWIFIPVRKVGYSEKLMRRYFGPYKVTRKISDVTYEVETFGNQQGRRKTKDLVHICRMKPYLNPEDQEDHLEEDPEDDSTNFQEEDIPTERTQQPQTSEEISGPITRSRALRLRMLEFGLNLLKLVLWFIIYHQLNVLYWGVQQNVFLKGRGAVFGTSYFYPIQVCSFFPCGKPPFDQDCAINPIISTQPHKSPGFYSESTEIPQEDVLEYLTPEQRSVLTLFLDMAIVGEMSNLRETLFDFRTECDIIPDDPQLHSSDENNI
ncbi:K02A2.6-like [Cordylochernes scorpioides]|uniref:K02A2.6-like n=1 Tax=Cordylochernes scorpioides TaxID=51811 RepID=A0ABY6KQK2_9ARAC|nr:K02A2.6-like [Cordylochernes scorpioides]